MDLSGMVVAKGTVPCRIEAVMNLLGRYVGEVTVGVASTYNWYWLLDGLQQQEVPCLLGHALYMKRAMSFKHKNDPVDSRAIADLLRCNRFPPACACPCDMRTVRISFFRTDKTGSLFAGMEYTGSLGEMLALKADFGYRGIGEGSNTFSVLLEPALSPGDFSIATSYYQFFDPDKTGMNYVDDELYGYIEPGYSFNETVALGLPLEVHTADETAADEAMVDRSAFRAVPTLYLYPVDGIAWWLWARAVVPFADNGDNAYGMGSEISGEFRSLFNRPNLLPFTGPRRDCGGRISPARLRGCVQRA